MEISFFIIVCFKNIFRNSLSIKKMFAPLQPENKRLCNYCGFVAGCTVVFSIAVMQYIFFPQQNPSFFISTCTFQSVFFYSHRLMSSYTFSIRDKSLYAIAKICQLVILAIGHIFFVLSSFRNYVVP